MVTEYEEIIINNGQRVDRWNKTITREICKNLKNTIGGLTPSERRQRGNGLDDLIKLLYLQNYLALFTMEALLWPIKSN